jgi:septal ring factor EnvC (AmiA/AmiB activator)
MPQLNEMQQDLAKIQEKINDLHVEKRNLEAQLSERQRIARLVDRIKLGENEIRALPDAAIGRLARKYMLRDIAPLLADDPRHLPPCDLRVADRPLAMVLVALDHFERGD